MVKKMQNSQMTAVEKDEISEANSFKRGWEIPSNGKIRNPKFSSAIKKKSVFPSVAYEV